MNHEKFKELSKLTATLGVCIEYLFQTQEVIIDFICKECDIPMELKEDLIADLNKTMGVKKIKSEN